jgi:hypothetical protein
MPAPPFCQLIEHDCKWELAELHTGRVPSTQVADQGHTIGVIKLDPTVGTGWDAFLASIAGLSIHPNGTGSLIPGQGIERTAGNTWGFLTLDTHPRRVICPFSVPVHPDSGLLKAKHPFVPEGTGQHAAVTPRTSHRINHQTLPHVPSFALSPTVSALGVLPPQSVDTIFLFKPHSRICSTGGDP